MNTFLPTLGRATLFKVVCVSACVGRPGYMHTCALGEVRACACVSAGGQAHCHCSRVVENGLPSSCCDVARASGQDIGQLTGSVQVLQEAPIWVTDELGFHTAFQRRWRDASL